MSRSAGSRQKSRSRAACTREPRVAATDGGSGRRSMAENRKDSAQLVNDDTFEGERLLGRGNGMAPGYADPVTVPRDRLIRPDLRARRRRPIGRATGRERVGPSV